MGEVRESGERGSATYGSEPVRGDEWARWLEFTRWPS